MRAKEQKRPASLRWIRGLSGVSAALWLSLVSGCGQDRDGVSYAHDVQPLFERRCVICHHSGNSGLVDIEDPFTPDFDSPAPGLIGSRNMRALEHPLPPFNLVPFVPQASFVLQKVTDDELKPGCDPMLGHCKSNDAGFFMPPAVKRLPQEKIAAVRLWVTLGAEEDDFYRMEVLSIFGDPQNRRETECENGGMLPGCIMCISCHHEGSAYPPDLTRPFDPVVGVVGIKSTFRVDLDLVKPFDPDGSLLVRKLEAIGATSEYGAPMPYGYEPLTTTEVELLTQWIEAGAPNN
jgi:hypothetical protein